MQYATARIVCIAEIVPYSAACSMCHQYDMSTVCVINMCCAPSKVPGLKQHSQEPMQCNAFKSAHVGSKTSPSFFLCACNSRQPFLNRIGSEDQPR